MANRKGILKQYGIYLRNDPLPGKVVMRKENGDAAMAHSFPSLEDQRECEPLGSIEAVAKWGEDGAVAKAAAFLECEERKLLAIPFSQLKGHEEVEWLIAHPLKSRLSLEETLEVLVEKELA